MSTEVQLHVVQSMTSTMTTKYFYWTRIILVRNGRIILRKQRVFSRSDRTFTNTQAQVVQNNLLGKHKLRLKDTLIFDLNLLREVNEQ